MGAYLKKLARHNNDIPRRDKRGACYKYRYIKIYGMSDYTLTLVHSGITSRGQDIRRGAWGAWHFGYKWRNSTVTRRPFLGNLLRVGQPRGNALARGISRHGRKSSASTLALSV